MLLFMIHTIEHGISPNREELEQRLIDVAVGNQGALEELYHRTRAAVYALALSILKNTQDTFVRIWECAAQYRPQGSSMAWLLTITRNLARMKLRQSAKHAELDDAQWEAIPADVPTVTPEDRHLLQTALATLTDEDRQVVMLHSVTG